MFRGIKKGDKVYVRDACISNGVYIVKRVGRLYFYVDRFNNEVKFSIETGRVFESNEGQAYLSEQGYINSVQCSALIHLIRWHMDKGIMKGMSLVKIKEVCDILGIEYEERNNSTKSKKE